MTTTDEPEEWDDGPDAVCRYCGTTFSGVGDDCGGCSLEALKAAGFHWSGGSWCGYRSKLPAELAPATEEPCDDSRTPTT